MTAERGAFLIRFDEARRAEILQELSSIQRHFSDALSTADWPIRQFEVCGLLFDEDVITYWALARRGRKVATGKARIVFSGLTPAHVRLSDIENAVGAPFKEHIIRAAKGTGARVPPRTWHTFKEALRSIDRESLERLERLERLRDQGYTTIDHPGVHIISQERDATGLAFDIFDSSGALRQRLMPAWTMPERVPSYVIPRWLTRHPDLRRSAYRAGGFSLSNVA